MTFDWTRSWALGFFIYLLLLVACNQDASEEPEFVDEEAVKMPGVLHFYNWDTYIGDTTLASFTEKTGVEVQYDLYANLEEMFAKFQAGNPGYDIIFPSDYMIETMIAAVLGLFEPLLILVMGAVVLVIVLAILLPIFDLNQLVQ